MRRIARIVIALAALFVVIRIYNYAFRANGWRAYPTAVRADLRNLDAAQEAYHTTRGRYASSVDSLLAAGFTVSTGVTVLVLRGDSTGYAATGHHRYMAPGFECTVARPGRDSSTAGAPRCRGMVDFLGRPRLAP